MELTAEIFILGGILTTIGTIIVLELYSKFRLGSVFKMIKNLDRFVNKKGSDEQLSEAVDSFIHIGGLASNANAIMASEELMEGLLSNLANRIMKSFKMSMLGTASGDVKKMAKAERLLNDGLIEGIKKLNPMIGIALKATGLDEEIKNDPELFSNILQLIMNNDGLMGMLGKMGGADGMIAGPQDQELIRQEIKKAGIDF